MTDQPKPTRAAPTARPVAAPADVPALRSTAAAGLRALRRFPGLLASIYLVQLGLSAGAGLLIFAIAGAAFGHRGILDQGMSGDVSALIVLARSRPSVLGASISIGLGAVALYWVVSWFLTAGLIAVLLDPPARRRDVARWFGAGGAVHFFAFLRLSLWSLIPYAVVLLALVSGASHLAGVGGSIMGVRRLVVVLVASLGPTILLNWIVATAVDYARIDLVRHPGLSTGRALIRGFRVIAARRVTLVHTLVYGLWFALVSAGYLGLASGLSGLAALVVVRQLASALRFAGHAALIAGQVEIARESVPAPIARG